MRKIPVILNDADRYTVVTRISDGQERARRVERWVHQSSRLVWWNVRGAGPKIAEVLAMAGFDPDGAPLPDGGVVGEAKGRV